MKYLSLLKDIVDIFVLTKIKGSRNKHNVARATVEALKMLRTAEKIAAQRGKEVKDILS